MQHPCELPHSYVANNDAQIGRVYPRTQVHVITSRFRDRRVARSSQPCLENKNLGRKQTLTYLKGYANESEPLMACGEARAPAAQSPTRAAAASPSGELGAASLAFGEPRSASALGESLPKWVENDRKVRGGRGSACAAGAARSLRMLAL